MIHHFMRATSCLMFNCYIMLCACRSFPETVQAHILLVAIAAAVRGSRLAFTHEEIKETSCRRRLSCVVPSFFGVLTVICFLAESHSLSALYFVGLSSH